MEVKSSLKDLCASDEVKEIVRQTQAQLRELGSVKQFVIPARPQPGEKNA